MSFFFALLSYILINFFYLYMNSSAPRPKTSTGLDAMRTALHLHGSLLCAFNYPTAHLSVASSLFCLPTFSIFVRSREAKANVKWNTNKYQRHSYATGSFDNTHSHWRQFSLLPTHTRHSSGAQKKLYSPFLCIFFMLL